MEKKEVMTKFIEALNNDEVEAIKKMISEENISKKNTMLRHAVIKGNKDIIKLLLDKGADINQKYENGITLLHDYVNEEEDIPILQMLIDNGADISIQDDFDSTPLDYAISIYNIKIFEFFIKNIKDINYQEPLNGNTILMGVIESILFNNFLKQDEEKNLFKMIKILLEAGADIDIITNNKGETALTLTKYEENDKVSIVNKKKELTEKIKEYLETELRERRNLLFLYSYIQYKNSHNNIETIISDTSGLELLDDSYNLITKIFEYI